MLDIQKYNFLLSRSPNKSGLRLHIDTILNFKLDCNLFEVYSPKTKYYYVVSYKKKND